MAVRYFDKANPNEPIESSAAAFAQVVVESCRVQNSAIEEEAACVPEFIPIADAPCRASYCEAKRYLCVAHNLAEAATLRSNTYETTGPESANTSYLVPPQSNATNAALLNAAAAYAERATAVSQLALDDVVSDCSSELCTCNRATAVRPIRASAPNPETFGKALANIYVDSFSLFRETLDKALVATVAAGDAQRASTSSRSEGIDRAVAGEKLSRAHAAHLLVGGALGLTEGAKEGLCDLPPLSPGGRRALDVLRLAAPLPSAVQDIPEGDAVSTLHVPIQSLLNDKERPAPGGSIRDRLRALWKLDALSLPLNSLDPEENIEAQLNLTESDFVEARRYLSEELDAFAADDTALVGVIGEGAPTYLKYGATAFTPKLPPLQYYSALARAGADACQRKDWLLLPDFPYTNPLPVGASNPADDYDPDVWGNVPAIYNLNLAAYVDRALSHAAFITNRAKVVGIEAFVTPGAEALAAVMSSVSTSLGRMSLHSDMRQGRVGAFEQPAANPEVGEYSRTFHALGFRAADGVKVVFGAAGLRCAVQGSVNGDADCNVGGIPLEDEVVGAAGLPYNPEFSHGVSAIVEGESFGYSNGDPLFFVRRKRDDNNAVLPDLPGNYEVLAGIPPRSGWAACGAGSPLSGFAVAAASAPVVLEAQRRAGELLAPSPESCTEQLMTCAGTRYDGRLPLEDELTNDGNGVESSWKHYLTLAKQAAAEADALGDAVVSSGIEFDRQLETNEQTKHQQELQANSYIDQLQAICGTAMEPQRLLSLLSTGEEGKNLVGLLGAPCDDDSDCPESNDVPFTCINPRPAAGTMGGGLCMADLVALANSREDPDLHRIADCLGTSGVTPWVTLGDKPLCLYASVANPNVVCPPVQEAGDTSSTACPVPVAAGTSCVPATFNLSEAEAGNREIAVITAPAVPLTFFEDRGPPRPAEATDGPCALVRKLRGASVAQYERSYLLGQIQRSTAFHPDVLAELNKRVRWQAGYGGFSQVFLDDRPVFTTGDAFTTGPGTTAWPCGPSGKPECQTGAGGLFCSQYACTSNGPRAVANDRLFRAVVGMEAIHSGLWTSVRMPIYVDGADNPAAGQNQSLRRISLAPPTPPGAPFTPRPIVEARYRMPDLDVNSAVEHIDGYEPNFTGTDVTAWGARLDDAYFDSSGVAMKNVNLANGLHFGIMSSLWSHLIYDVWFVGARRSQTISLINGLSESTGGNDYLKRLLDMTPTQRSSTWPHFDGYGGPGSYEAEVPQAYWDGFELYTSLNNGLWEGSVTFAVEPVLKPFDWSSESLLDALELACELNRDDLDSAEACPAPGDVTSTNPDLRQVEKHLTCVGRAIEERMSRQLFANFPRVVIDQIEDESPVGTFPRVGGELGVAVATLRGAMVQFQEAGPLIGQEIKKLGYDIQDLRLTMERLNLVGQVQELQFQAQVAQQIADCAAEASGALGSVAAAATGNLKGIGDVGSAVAACANSAAQINFASQINEIQQQITGADQRLALNDFNSKFSTHSSELQRLALQLTKAGAEVDAQLATIEARRMDAFRALRSALAAANWEASTTQNVNAAMLSRFSTNKVRYATSLDNAKKMTFLAKRAIEQRLGISLAEMREDLPLVAAPASWESTICAVTGIDYSKISDPENVGGDGGGPITRTSAGFIYADQYIGDYVTRLENVVESYRLVNNFHEGTDTAVISLRDDVAHARGPCEKQLRNLLYEAGQLDVLADPEEGDRGWSIKGCSPTNPLDCISARPLVASVSDPNTNPIPDTALSAAGTYRVQFRDGTATCSIAGAGNCGYTAAARMVQRISLDPGSYRLSWYARGASNVGATAVVVNACTPVAASDETDCLAPAAVSGTAGSLPTSIGTWNRYFAYLTVTQAQSYEVAVKHPAGAALTHVDVGGIMLEAGQVPPAPPLTIQRLPAFENTRQSLTRELPLCEDTQGIAFRRDHWSDLRCVHLCSDGFGDECKGASGAKSCYRETTFSFNQKDIEAGTMVTQAGFARGNFNYRIESVGVNFVGSGLRQCEDTDLPQTCYSAGFIPYSLHHWGPFYVRNYEGADFEARLFDGAIEHARGLATERYLTNPISGGDSSLIEQYMRSEFQGRPLDGNFVLRVWDEPEVEFNRIEDAQIVLKYRYWTRFK